MERDPKRRNKIKYLPSYSIAIEGFVLVVRPTANAWWKDEWRLRILIADFKEGRSVSEACERAGITTRKYKYFSRLHRDISRIRKACLETLVEKAKDTVGQKVNDDPRFSLRFLMKMKPDEFPTPPLLRKVASLEKKLEEEVEKYRDEIRELKIIIGHYEEAAHSETESEYEKYIAIAEKCIRHYNHRHRTGHQMIKPLPKNYNMTPEGIFEWYQQNQEGDV